MDVLSDYLVPAATIRLGPGHVGHFLSLPIVLEHLPSGVLKANY
jgi:hypothetical protein